MTDASSGSGSQYYSFGYVQPHNDIKSYLAKACTQKYGQWGASYGNSPTFEGEWWIAVGFDGATDQNYRDFGDAQRYNFANNGVSQSFSWSFKITSPKVYSARGAVTRDYIQSVKAGLLPSDPTTYFNSSICAGY